MMLWHNIHIVYNEDVTEINLCAIATTRDRILVSIQNNWLLSEVISVKIIAKIPLDYEMTATTMQFLFSIWRCI